MEEFLRSLTITFSIVIKIMFILPLLWYGFLIFIKLFDKDDRDWPWMIGTIVMYILVWLFMLYIIFPIIDVYGG